MDGTLYLIVFFVSIGNYKAFVKDLNRRKEEVIIESPYVTCHRMSKFENIFRKLIDRGIKVYVITRSPKEHSLELARQAELKISIFEEMGIEL